MKNAPTWFLVTAATAVLLLTGSVGAVATESAGHHDQAYLLWPDGAPEADGDEDADRPQVTVHLPDPGRGTGTAVIVNPGGGYRVLASDHEGLQVARWLEGTVEIQSGSNEISVAVSSR